MFFVVIGLVVAPRLSSACDWPVANDIYRMSSKAPRISLVTATGTHSAVVQRDLKGKGPTALATGKTNCDPYFTKGATYLLFHDGRGGSISDSSAARVDTPNGRRLLQSLLDFRAAKPNARDRVVLKAFTDELQRALRATVHRGKNAEYSTRLLVDGKRYLGSLDPARENDYQRWISHMSGPANGRVATPVHGPPSAP